MLTYDLPKELIAQRPCEPRDSARLLVLDRAGGQISHQTFRDLPNFLHPGDCLVLNDTKVVPARLYGWKADTGGKVELLILGQACPERRSSFDLAQDERSRQDRDERGCVYRCLGQPGRRLRPGTKLLFDHGSLRGEVISSESGEKRIKFFTVSLDETADQILTRLGEVPLPPYIRRPVEPSDAEWYQTVFAREAGAVAAPTAGLHFTGALLDRIREIGVRVAFVTLHVGWGTFKPVGERELKEAKLHPERFQVPPETIDVITETKKNGKRVIAVGTTVVRALETWAAGDAVMPRAWKDRRPTNKEAEFGDGSEPVRTLTDGAEGRGDPHRTEGPRRGANRGRTRSHVSGATTLFIRPPFEFQVVDAVITNFHLPGTSLLLLVAAFAGEERMRSAYQEAVRERYRFYSYGDAMFIV